MISRDRAFFPFSLLLAIFIAGCVGVGARPPETTAERFSLAYEQTTQAYRDLLSAVTPVEPGAMPMLTREQAKAVLDRLNQAKATLDVAYEAFRSGQAYANDFERWEAALRAARRAIPVRSVPIGGDQ
jgi:hypothetical protein